MVSEDSRVPSKWIESFLLIDRTCRIVTALHIHARTVHSGCLMTFGERVAQDTNGVSSK
jgi:hypothetical protein